MINIGTYPWDNLTLLIDHTQDSSLHNLCMCLILLRWWVYPSDTLLWPSIFDFLSFSIHCWSSNIYCTNVTFVRSPPTIPYTHRTIGPVPHRRPLIWPMDHIITFPFLSLFSFTWCILLRSNQSLIVAPCDRDLTICFAAHEPCARFTYHLYLRLLYLLRKRRKFSTENSDLSSSHLIVSLHSIFTPLHLHSISYSRHPSPYCTIPNLHLTLLCTPWYYVRRPFHRSRIAPLRTT